MRIAIIKADGTITWKERAAAQIKLDELQRIVGGYIERVPMPDDFPGDVWANEEGLLEGLPLNKTFSTMMRRAWCAYVLATSPDDPFSVLDPRMMQIVGDVVWVVSDKTELN